MEKRESKRIRVTTRMTAADDDEALLQVGVVHPTIHNVCNIHVYLCYVIWARGMRKGGI